MKRRILVMGLLALALGGCEYRHKKAIEKIANDEEILRKVGAAVNEVLRNARAPPRGRAARSRSRPAGPRPRPG